MDGQLSDAERRDTAIGAVEVEKGTATDEEIAAAVAMIEAERAGDGPRFMEEDMEGEHEQ